ncbi:MAG: choice-of-anchor J domain-containing protein [Bacteroidia bacterium]
MKKTHIISVFILFIGVVICFHSCIKDVGQPIKPPFSFHETEGFENSSTLPSGWKLINPDNDAAWEIVTTVAHTGSNCIGFNNCSGDGNTDMTGRRDWLISKSYDFSKATSVNLSFDIAYALLLFKNQEYPDTLAIFSSTDGGTTWDSLYIKGGSDLSNIQPITLSPPCWAPASSSDWRTDYISLNKLAGQPNVIFAFENRSAWGQWIYLDNITISAGNGSTDCDKITYSKDIAPIIKDHCATSGCHAPNGSGPSDYSTFDAIKSDADNGELKKRMIDGNPSFMPSSGKLDEAMLSKVTCWLNAGAPNN